MRAPSYVPEARKARSVSAFGSSSSPMARALLIQPTRSRRGGGAPRRVGPTRDCASPERILEQIVKLEASRSRSGPSLATRIEHQLPGGLLNAVVEIRPPARPGEGLAERRGLPASFSPARRKGSRLRPSRPGTSWPGRRGPAESDRGSPAPPGGPPGGRQAGHPSRKSGTWAVVLYGQGSCSDQGLAPPGSRHDRR